LVVVTTGCGQPSNPAAEEAAVAAARAWLELVDKGEYDESWQEAADFFTAVVKLDQWQKTMLAIRKPMGQIVSRELRSKKYRTALPGAPDGEYVIIQFNTVFGNKKKAIETITPMLDTNGTWRVSGYFIR
jgi:hypothetical protein